MDVTKYRIRKREGRWHVFSPGWVASPAFTGNNFRHCVSALPYLQRIAENRRRMRRG